MLRVCVHVCVLVRKGSRVVASATVMLVASSSSRIDGCVSDRLK